MYSFECPVFRSVLLESTEVWKSCLAQSAVTDPDSALYVVALCDLCERAVLVDLSILFALNSPRAYVLRVCICVCAHP